MFCQLSNLLTQFREINMYGAITRHLEVLIVATDIRTKNIQTYIKQISYTITHENKKVRFESNIITFQCQFYSLKYRSNKQYSTFIQKDAYDNNINKLV